MFLISEMKNTVKWTSNSLCIH